MAPKGSSPVDESQKEGRKKVVKKIVKKIVKVPKARDTVLANPIETETVNLDTPNPRRSVKIVKRIVKKKVPKQSALENSPPKTEDLVSAQNTNDNVHSQTLLDVDSGKDTAQGILLSGEMEALERKKRRRTEIFIGGLDKDTKETDIRTIFEEVGQVLDVTLLINRETGKNKGFAFLRYASAADAKKAVQIYSKVEISGKQCGVSLVEGNDTIYLGNIDKKWKTEDVIDLLKKAGIENIDKVTVMTDPTNIEQNRGFAFVELETSKEAQIAFNKLQKKNVFGKQKKVKVAWAQPLIEPNEEEMLKVKSVYAEYLPSSWNEEKVKEYFGKFGEIDSIALAKDLPSSKRKDFAFVNYIGRESALACIEAFSHEPVNDSGFKVNMKVSLAKPMPKSKQTKRATVPSKRQPREEKKIQNQSISKRDEPSNKVNYMRRYAEGHSVDGGSSTTNELLHLLRQQASGGQIHSGLRIGSGIDHQYSLSGSKRPFSAVADNPNRIHSVGVSRVRLESSFPTGSQSMLPHTLGPLGMPSVAYYRQLGVGHPSGYGVGSFPSSFQIEGDIWGCCRTDVSSKMCFTDSIHMEVLNCKTSISIILLSYMHACFSTLGVKVCVHLNLPKPHFGITLGMLTPPTGLPFGAICVFSARPTMIDSYC